MDIEKRFAACLRRIGTGRVCLIALSGGGDSVALLDLAHRVSPGSGLALHAARVVHNIRDAPTEEEENRFCSGFCSERSIPFAILHTDGGVPAMKSMFKGRGVEQSARFYRRCLLEDHARAIGAETIMTGHTADDVLETVFMRLLSGSGPEGLAGIPEALGMFRRPLLGITRKELRSYLEDHSIRWMEDASNDETSYLRNRFRNELIPFIGDILPGWKAALKTLGERSSEVSDALERMYHRELPEIPSGDGCIVWREADWRQSADYTRAMALWKAFDRLDRVGAPDRRISWRRVKSARKAIDDGESWTDGRVGVVRRNGRVTAMVRPNVLKRVPGQPENCGRVVLDRMDLNQERSVCIGGWIVQVRRRPPQLPEGWQVVEIGSAGRICMDFYNVQPPVCTPDRPGPDDETEFVYIHIGRVEGDAGRQEQV